MKEKKNAIILVAIIAVLFLTSLSFIFLKGDVSCRYAYIYQNNTLIKTIDIDNIENSYTFTISNENGGFNTIVIKDGSIGITDASCPDSLCKNMGFINTDAMPITCLPNHLVIKLSDDISNKEDIDGIAY